MDRSNLKKAKPMLYDPLIISRVKQYLEENVHQTYVDVGVMARVLQERYREYNRRKAVPFRQLIEQAYKTVLHSYGLDSNPSSEDNDDGSDLELMEDRTDGNDMNNVLTDMYSANVNKSPQQGSDGVLIDISSDEDNEKEPKNKAPYPSHINQVSITKLTGKKPEHIKHICNNKNDNENTNQINLPSNLHATKRRKIDGEYYSGKPYQDIREHCKHTTFQKNVDNQSAQSSPLTAPVAAQSGGKPSKKFKKEVTPQVSCLSFKDIGGMDHKLKELCELLLHIKHPQVYKHIGLPSPRGFLLHGPPGSGKTLLAHAIAGQLNVGLIEIPATELIAGVSGESEERIRGVFEQAVALAPCVLFIDEIDAISSNRLNAQKDMERRIVSQLLSSIDSLSNYENGNQVLVIGATNRPDSLDPALRRVGRFDQEICIGIPDRSAREHILKIICSNLKLEKPFNFESLATLTPGYVGADLLALATRAASIAIKRVFTSKRESVIRKNLNLMKSTPFSVVNLTGDSLFMEIDSVLSMVENENDEVIENGIGEKVGEKSNDLTIELDKEDTDKTQKNVNDCEKSKILNGDDITIDITDEQKVVEEKDKILNENDVVQSTEKAETNQEKSIRSVDSELIDNKSVDIDIDIINDIPTDNKDAMETDAESVDVNKAQQDNVVGELNVQKETNNENKAEDVEIVNATNENDKKQNEENDNVKAVQSEPEKVSQEKNKIEGDVIDISDETLEDAIMKNSSVKLHLSLEEMTKWLNDKQLPISQRELQQIYISMNDFQEALKLIQPSAKREGFITVPDVTWDDIGSLRDIRDELQMAVLAPVKFPEKMKILGLQAASGVLLCGPPGCGKTLLAKAIANEAGINFISVKGPELLNMYVGESERAVRQCFQRAKNSAPCVIFFDEFDALCPRRTDSGDGNASSRVVNQLLTEMDGVEDRNGVFLMAATNRPDIVDPAVLRPGRLDKILYVGLPEQSDRMEILTALTKNKTKPPLNNDVDLMELASLTNNYTGADLAGLVRQASLQTLKEHLKLNTNNDEIQVNKHNFLDALNHIRPSVSEQDKKYYETLRRKYTILTNVIPN